MSNSSESDRGDMVKMIETEYAEGLCSGFFGCAFTLSPGSFVLLFCLRVIASVVVVTEESKNTDDQTH